MRSKKLTYLTALAGPNTLLHSIRRNLKPARSTYIRAKQMIKAIRRLLKRIKEAFNDPFDVDALMTATDPKEK